MRLDDVNCLSYPSTASIHRAEKVLSARERKSARLKLPNTNMSNNIETVGRERKLYERRPALFLFDAESRAHKSILATHSPVFLGVPSVISFFSFYPTRSRLYFPSTDCHGKTALFFFLLPAEKYWHIHQLGIFFVGLTDKVSTPETNKHTRDNNRINFFLFLNNNKKKKISFPIFVVVLVCPDGADGLRVGRGMEETNRQIYKRRKNKKRRRAASQHNKNQENHPSFIMSIEEE